MFTTPPRQRMRQEGVVHDDGGVRAEASPGLMATLAPIERIPRHEGRHTDPPPSMTAMLHMGLPCSTSLTTRASAKAKRQL